MFKVYRNPNEDSEREDIGDEDSEAEVDEEEDEVAGVKSKKRSGRRKRASTPARKKRSKKKTKRNTSSQNYGSDGRYYNALLEELANIECEEGTGKGVQSCMHEVAEATRGFSGRQIAKMMISCQGMIYGTKRSALTPELLGSLVRRKVDEHARKTEMAANKRGSSGRSTDNKFNYA